MYGWIWRHLPGPFLAKLLQTLVLIGIAVWVLFEYLFPKAEPLLPFLDVTVDQEAPSAHSAAVPLPVE